MFDARVWRRAPRPIPVLVDPHAGLRMGFTRYDGVPMWLRASGFRIDPPHPGQALEWLRLDDGQYLVRVRFHLLQMGGQGLEVVTWLLSTTA